MITWAVISSLILAIGAIATALVGLWRAIQSNSSKAVLDAKVAALEATLVEAGEQISRLRSLPTVTAEESVREAASEIAKLARPKPENE